MTAAGSPRPEGSAWTAGLGSFVGEQSMTRPPGYPLPPLPSVVLIPLANIDEAVQRYSRQTMTIESEERTLEPRKLMMQLDARA